MAHIDYTSFIIQKYALIHVNFIIFIINFHINIIIINFPSIIIKIITININYLHILLTINLPIYYFINPHYFFIFILQYY